MRCPISKTRQYGTFFPSKITGFPSSITARFYLKNLSSPGDRHRKTKRVIAYLSSDSFFSTQQVVRATITSSLLVAYLGSWGHFGCCLEHIHDFIVFWDSWNNFLIERCTCKVYTGMCSSHVYLKNVPNTFSIASPIFFLILVQKGFFLKLPFSWFFTAPYCTLFFLFTLP